MRWLKDINTVLHLRRPTKPHYEVVEVRPEHLTGDNKTLYRAYIRNGRNEPVDISTLYRDELAAWAGAVKICEELNKKGPR